MPTDSLLRTREKLAPHDELILDAFRSGFDTLHLSRVFCRPEPGIAQSIDRARNAERARTHPEQGERA
jgi:hypothetical protein